jgi:hypothetical protein
MVDVPALFEEAQDVAQNDNVEVHGPLRRPAFQPLLSKGVNDREIDLIHANSAKVPVPAVDCLLLVLASAQLLLGKFTTGQVVRCCVFELWLVTGAGEFPWRFSVRFFSSSAFASSRLAASSAILRGAVLPLPRSMRSCA